MTRTLRPPLSLVTATLVLLGTLGDVRPQERPQPGTEGDVQIRVEPATLTLRVGGEAELRAEVVDAGGRPVDARVVFFSLDREAVRVSADGKVQAVRPGEFEIVVRVAQEGRTGPSVNVPIVVPYPKPARIAFVEAVRSIHVGTTARARATVFDAAGMARDDLPITWSSQQPELATVDAFGHITGIAPGRGSITARGEGLSANLPVEVIANPVRSLELTANLTQARTGDVVQFAVVARNAQGAAVEDVPVHLALDARPTDDRGAGATGQIEPDGRFVAETPGIYTVFASCGSAVARASIRAVPRDVQMKLELVGRGPVLGMHTSDLWVWEGVDGRDYAVTGTWGADGEAIFWDVTDPGEIERIATVKVDARTVNDVKVSEDGRLCVLSREGASNRKNGIVIVDVQNPREPKLLSTFTDQLTGGVHNLFIADQHVYALSAARRYDVINIEDPQVPKRVGTFELDTLGHSIHDVWVENGLAYSSNWRDGVQIVDVGNGVKGGSPANPVRVASYTYPSGWNHAAFPFRSRDTGKFYVIAGDEAFPYGLHVQDKPTYPRGWFHFIDFSDLQNPREVARYEVPEAGTHNLWVEGDRLYAAYYNGGVRVVDISGDLLGDLYRQGREIAWFIPTDRDGVVPNAAMTWGPQPHKGHIFFSDWNTGLWAVRLVPDDGRRR